MPNATYGPSLSSSLSTTSSVYPTHSPTLVRPWSAPLPTGRAGRVRRACGTAALVAASLLGGLGIGYVAAPSAGASPLPAVSRPLDPPCGYVVEGRKLTVVSLSASGRVRVYRNAPYFDKVRDRAPIGPGESMSLRLKRSGHSELDLVAYVGRSECEPA